MSKKEAWGIFRPDKKGPLMPKMLQLGKKSNFWFYICGE